MKKDYFENVIISGVTEVTKGNNNLKASKTMRCNVTTKQKKPKLSGVTGGNNKLKMLPLLPLKVTHMKGRKRIKHQVVTPVTLVTLSNDEIENLFHKYEERVGIYHFDNALSYEEAVQLATKDTLNFFIEEYYPSIFKEFNSSSPYESLSRFLDESYPAILDQFNLIIQ